MILENAEALRLWLTKEMAPICDAEPAALAKYVLALLRKDKPEAELREFCIDQLDVFLTTKARPFVEKLFMVIKDRSYLPASTMPIGPQLMSSPSAPMKANVPTEEKKKDIDERRESREAEKAEERKKSHEKERSIELRATLDRDRDRDLRKVRGEKEPEKRLVPAEASNAGSFISTQQQKPQRKRISPPPVTVREERRDHSAQRFERRRSRSPHDRRQERGTDRRPLAPSVGNRGGSRPGDRYKNDRPERLERVDRTERTERTDRVERNDRLDRSERTERKRSRSPHDRSRREKSSDPTERKKRRCRDYDEKGYCRKGEQCQYDHGPDPVVVDDIALEMMVGTGAAKPTAPIVPAITANFSVPPPGYTPLNPPPPGVDNVYIANTAVNSNIGLSEGYNPEAPALNAASAPPAIAAPSVDFSVPPPPLPAHIAGGPTWRAPTYTVPSASASVLVHPTPAVTYEQCPVPAPTVPVTVTQPSVMYGTGSRGRGRGGISRYSAPLSLQQQSSANNRTLQVRKIPVGMNNIAKLNEHFAQFGVIVNMQVCYDGDPEAALLTYATRSQAVAAYKSTIPILNNRFIKVFWHSPESGISSHVPGVTSTSAVTYNAKGSLTKTVQYGSKQQTVGSSFPSSMAGAQLQPVSQQEHQDEIQKPKIAQYPAVVDKEKYIEIRRRRKQEKENRMRLLDLHRRKSDLLAKEIEQQKEIVEKIKRTEDTEKRKKLYKIFKTLDVAVKKLKIEVTTMSEQLLALAGEGKERNNKQSERKENSDANGNEYGKRTRSLSEGSNDETHKDVTAALKKARHIDSSSTLDNRPRIVAVSGYSAEQEESVIAHMGKFGELVDMDTVKIGSEKLPNALFTYKKRRDAEQAVAYGGDFSLCTLNVGWAPKGGIDEAIVVPDEKRKPSDRVTAADLLASCPLAESDEEEVDG
ncbi:hypothetical protein AB6A40_004685 [Gnathostoma spinigerum]|uniref:C3H1-type domain-containing protein n=1 Tax=Gnathostoma spinigerum TaxID=75299 RepID=A0ABD6EE97_9BILA